MPVKYKTLKGEKNFHALFESGSFYKGKRLFLKVFFDPSTRLEESQWAFCSPRKLGKAVVRSRYRRVCREALHALMQDLIPISLGCRIALVPQNSFIKLKADERKASLFSLLKKAKLIGSESLGKTHKV